MSIRFGFPAIFLTSLVMFAGGAVPGFFLIPFKLAVKAILLTRTSQVAGNSIGQGGFTVRNVFGEGGV